MPNPFVFGCITPHGSEIVEELAGGNPDLMRTTRESMTRLGELMSKSQPDTIIVLTPHGLRIHGQFSISNSENLYGELSEGDGKITIQRKNDRQLARAIQTTAQERGLPVAAVNYATAEGPLSCLPLDWGVVVPLQFMPETEIVVITPTRERSFADHLAFGNVLREVASKTEKRIAIIASCDWAHAHQEDGPYGFHAAAAELDREVVNLLKANKLESLVEFSPQFIEDAKPDGNWQTLILAGAIPEHERIVEVLSYEVPTYFGLICAEIKTR